MRPLQNRWEVQYRTWDPPRYPSKPEKSLKTCITEPRKSTYCMYVQNSTSQPANRRCSLTALFTFYMPQQYIYYIHTIHIYKHSPSLPDHFRPRAWWGIDSRDAGMQVERSEAETETATRDGDMLSRWPRDVEKARFRCHHDREGRR